MTHYDYTTTAALAAFYPAGPTAEQRKALAREGWVIAEGRPAPGGFYAARQGGGYESRITVAEEVVAITAGCPASHAEVAYKLAIR